MDITNEDSDLPLPPVPAKFHITTFLLIFLFFGMGIYCTYTENWIGAIAEFGIGIIQIIFAIIRYRDMSKLERQRKNILVMQEILDIPILREEGYSIIISLIFPSRKITEEMQVFSDSIKSKK